MQKRAKRHAAVTWVLGTAMATTALVGLSTSAATAAPTTEPVPQAAGPRYHGAVPAQGSCTDWGINGWGDCNKFISNCGKGGGHAHALNESGIFPSITYTCHSGDTHRSGD